MRTAVASLCVKRTPIRGRYRHVCVLAIPYDLEAA